MGSPYIVHTLMFQQGLPLKLGMLDSPEAIEPLADGDHWASRVSWLLEEAEQKSDMSMTTFVMFCGQRDDARAQAHTPVCQRNIRSGNHGGLAHARARVCRS